MSLHILHVFTENMMQKHLTVFPAHSHILLAAQSTCNLTVKIAVPQVPDAHLDTKDPRFDSRDNREKIFSFSCFVFFFFLAFKKVNHSKGSKQFSKLKLLKKMQNNSRSSILLRATAKNLLEVAWDVE